MHEHEPPASPVTASAQPVELRPVSMPFLLSGLGTSLLVAVMLAPFFAICIGGAGPFFVVLASVPFFMVLVGIGVANSFFSYGKTSYTIAEDRLIFRGGGIGANQELEVGIEKITQVTVRQPLWERALFGTGTVAIDAAGSSGLTTRFRHITNPQELYDRIQERMRSRGFSLTRSRLVTQERPSLVACVISTLPTLFGFFFAGAVIFAIVAFIHADQLGATSLEHFLDLLSGAAQPADTSPEAMTGAEARRNLLLLALGWGLTLGMAAFFSALASFTMRRRLYTLHDDVIDYEQRSLTHIRRFIPIENIADVTLRQRFLMRLLRIADVAISCQGATGTIRLRWVPRGRDFVERLRELMEGAEALGTSAETADSPRTCEASSREASSPEVSRPEAINLRQSVLRTLLGPLVQETFKSAIVFIILVAAAYGLYYLGTTRGADLEGVEAYQSWILIGLAVVAGFPVVVLLLKAPGVIARVRATRYSAGPRSVTMTYTLLSKDETRFAAEKITAVLVHRTPWDRIFRTATLEFRSIGSPTPLLFLHVPTSAFDLGQMLALLGITPSASPTSVRARFSVIAWTAARGHTFPKYLIMSLVTLPLVYFHLRALLLPVLVLIIAPISDFARQWAVAGRGRIELHDHHVWLQRGVLRTLTFAARYRDLKHLGSTRYPLGDRGRITLFAGTGASASLPYVEDPRALHAMLGERMHQTSLPAGEGPRGLDRTPLSVHRPAMTNAFANLLIACLVFFPILPLFPFVALWTYLRVKHTSYVIERERVLVQGGILWKSERSVLRSRIDNVTTSQGMLNKLFNNGNVGISTAGSSHIDLNMSTIANHLAVAQQLQTP